MLEVLESDSATGIVIAPFIVWQGKTHRECYYPHGGFSNEGLMTQATFAVSESSYMDDELGFAFIKEHFEPLTRGARLYLHAVRPRNFLSSAEDANRVRGCYQVCFPSVGGLKAGYT